MMHPSSDSEAELPGPQTNNIPEESEDIMILSDDAGAFHPPPPRIAARFYRSANNRRKSSAPSSRRNSISSTHSHTSGRSYRGSQSNHVAQHLRRASILEERKARLAERAAHAEQVRLRAALAKAAVRTSNSEERALAAQQAREKHLAQIAAACAEEVRRAKQVAEDMKERKAAEERRYRQEMEEKMAEAERRRREYQQNARRARATSVPAAVKRPTSTSPVPRINDEVAAKRIQNAWRTRHRKQLLDEFTNLGLSIDKVHESSFEEVGQLLSDEKVLSTTARILGLFRLEGSEGCITKDPVAIRTFLSAYLILGHPAEVLSKDGDQEQDLINKAKELVIIFESALSKLSRRSRYLPTPTQLETLSLAHTSFVTAFSDWKARDASALVETMIASFVNLDSIWQSVKDDTSGEVARDYREGIRDNQVILLSKIRKLVGPERANMLIKKAIAESRRARRKRPVGDVRPRPAVEESSRSSSPQAPAAATAKQVESASKLSEARKAGTDVESKAFSKLFTVIPPNRILVHELAIDKEYRIEVSPHSQVRDSLNRAICDAMRKGFEDGQGAQWTLAVAENIREKLLILLKPGNSMHRLISESLDPELIQNEVRLGLFSYARFFTFMANILPKLCAPFRDNEVKQLAEELEAPEGDVGSMIERLFKLLHVIDLLVLDYSNFLLMQAAPTLLKESVGYEQHQFAQDLDSGKVTLEKTKRWWRNASVNILTEADRRDPINRPTSQKIYARGLVDLAVATPTLQDDDVPETLELDKARISRIRADVVRITTTGSILLTAKNLLKRDVRSQWKAEAIRMWESLKDGYQREDGTMPMKVLSIIESSHAMPPATRNQLVSTISRFLMQAHNGRLTDPVMKVLFQRLKGHIFTRLSASSSGERVRAVSTTSAGLASSGLPEFIGQVSDIVDQLTRVSDVDRKSHGVWYEQVAEEVERMGENSEATGVPAP